jgi:hypothetical protein
MFFGIFVEEIKTHGGLKLRPLPQLGWSKWKSLELLEEMPSPSQACLSLGLNGKIFLVLHL